MRRTIGFFGEEEKTMKIAENNRRFSVRIVVLPEPCETGDGGIRGVLQVL